MACRRTWTDADEGQMPGKQFWTGVMLGALAVLVMTLVLDAFAPDPGLELLLQDVIATKTTVERMDQRLDSLSRQSSDFESQIGEVWNETAAILEILEGR